MEKAHQRLERIKQWFSNPYNALLVLIAIIAFCIRLFFFIKTPGQTLWWDEAEYLSAAKEWAFGVPYDYNPQRPPLFQALSAIIFMLGFGEGLIKFALVLLPSVALVIATFYLGKEMYNEKIGIISSFLMACSWTLLFWTTRVQPDFFSMTFQIISITLMWRSWKQENARLGLYAGIFAALGFYFKISALLVPISFLVFIFIRDRLRGVNHKNHWYFATGFLVTLVPYFIWSYVAFGTPFAFSTNYSIAFTEEGARPFAIAQNLQFFYAFTPGLFFIIFIAGFVYAARILLIGDIIIKDRKEAIHPDLLSLIFILTTAAFYMFYIRGTEDRWVFIWLPFMFFFIANIIMLLHKFTVKHNRFIAGAIVAALVLFAGYQQVNQATFLIEQKYPSYLPVKEAGLWMKENSMPGDKILSVSYTQTVYYSERNVSTYSRYPAIANSSEMDEFVRINKPLFVMWSAFEQHPPWTIEWFSTREGNALQLAYYKLDEQQRPLVFVYAVNQTAFS